MEEVDVVIGIIMNEGKFLVERRRGDEEVDPGITSLPGGHVHPAESRREALEREMQEELGITVKTCRLVCKNFYIASNHERQNAYCYLIEDYKGTPVCNSAQDIFWEDNVTNLSLEVDRKTIKKLKERIQNEKF